MIWQDLKIKKMIQATDLRIGNWVNGILGTPERVRGTTSNGIWLHGYPIIQSLLTPIPLTPEILLKMGFKNQEQFDLYFKSWRQVDFNIFSGKNLIGQASGVGVDQFYMLINGVIHIIYFVHTLQNLFHALTGKELIFEL